MEHALSRPEAFTLTDAMGTPYRGADQEWFRDIWQRRAGCGPTAAAMILRYLSRRPDLADLAPENPADSPAAFLPYMEAVWDCVTPGTRGLDKPENFVLGCRSFARSRGCVLDGRVLPVPRKGSRTRRPTLSEVRTFLGRSLDRDWPVAFLNYSNGELDNLDSWHWVTLIASAGEGQALSGVILDGGEEKTVDLALWLETSLLGGAFAVLFPDQGVYGEDPEQN